MNIFAVLDVSDNEEEVKKTSTKKSKEAGKETKPASAKTAETKTAKPQDKSPKPQAEGKKETSSKPQKTVAAAEGENADAGKENHKREKTNRYNDKRAGFSHDGKRHNPNKTGNDRHSDVSKRVAKNGSGAFGAGNVREEANEAEKNPEAALEAAVPAEETEQEAAPAEVVEEPVDTTLSYDDFLRKRNEARAANDLFAPAKATRVVDATSLAGLKVVDEQEVIYIAPKNTKSSQSSKKDQRSTGKTQVVDVAFKFESAVPEYRRRDDNRGGERRPRTAGRGGDRKAPSANLNSGDFPSL